MRLLRLTNSFDTDRAIAPEANKTAVAEALIAEEIGEPVETTVRAIWPDAGLPALVESWLKRYQPDTVLLSVSSYWFTYTSVPLRVERKLGPVGKRLSRTGQKAARIPWLAHNAPFRALRKVTTGAIGGDTFFTPEQVVERVDACIHKVLAEEGAIALCVRGPRVPYAPDNSARARHWSEERRRLVHFRLKDLCRQYHVPYQGWDHAVPPQDRAGDFQGDFVHGNEAAHAALARQEADLILEAWRQQKEGAGPGA